MVGNWITPRCAIMDSLMNPDPLGELTIQVPEQVVDPYATVIAIDLVDLDIRNKQVLST
jgi:hypothetical protein